MMATSVRRYGWVLLAVVLACGATAWADILPASMPATSQSALAARAVSTTQFWPDLTWPTLCWIGGVLILALTLQPRPIFCCRNLDALVLAAMCVLLGMRDSAGAPCPSGRTWQWWGHLGLTIALVYWILRGMGLLAGRKPIRQPGTVSGGARVVLVLAGLALCVQQVATAPISPGSRDGIVGGLYTSATGKLPYGDAAGYENRSPLLYLVHAGAVRVVEPSQPVADGSVGREMTWGERDSWLTQNWVDAANLTPARLVNAAFFVLTLLGLFAIGRRLPVEGGGWMMVAIFCLFPGTRECLTCPEVMLPAALLTWTIAFALLPGMGGLLGMLCIVFAGLAWPWAWLAIPVLLAYFWRRGWQWFGSTAGLAGGVALCVLGAVNLVQPAIPRSAGVLKLAGEPPTYAARRLGADTLAIERRTPTSDESRRAALTARLWQALLAREALAVQQPGQSDRSETRVPLKFDWPNGVDPQTVLYQDVDADAQALPLLQEKYRAALADTPPTTRLLAAVRTVLESTWPLAGALPRPTTSSWDLWGGAPETAERWIMIRRIAKLVLGLLVIWATLAIFFGRRTQPRHLLGALLLTASGILLVSEQGAAANQVWLLPLLGTLWALHEPQTPSPRSPAPPVRAFSPAPAPIPLGPAPRITLEATAPDKPAN